jgi:hypothetical protein
MLPRKKYLHVLCLSLAVMFGASSLVSAPAQAITGYTPPVTVQTITPKFVIKASSTSSKTLQVLAPTVTKPFSVVGLTWLGALPSDTIFKVRVREAGKWSSWNELNFSDDHGVDAASLEANGTRIGTDPFMTAVADAIEVTLTNKSGTAPNDLKVDLIGSQETWQDRALLTNVRSLDATGNPSDAAVTPGGGVVLRPNIVTRAQWGANETWRDPVPRMGTTIVAGFVHHTASTNNYSPEQAPAQMRALYAYYTKSLKYADMAYSFLVDQYGTVYEGRNACTYGDVNPCDGASRPGIGAHTAGLNVNTFAISAIGNYDTKRPSHPDAMVESIASLMAWKLAPYGLDPNANASMVSTDTSGSSKYSNGMTAITPVISGHRDVGKTACPGRYLYPYLPAIRARATELLAPVIHGVSVTPNLIDVTIPKPVNVSAVIPAGGNWTVTVSDVATGDLIKSASGTQPTTSALAFTWDGKDPLGAPVVPGRYLVSIAATVGTAVLPTTTSEIVIANKPSPVTKITYKRLGATKALITWKNSAAVLPITSQYIRVSTDEGKTYGKWIKTSKASSKATFKTWKKGRKYVLQVKVVNSLGKSAIATKKFTMR